MLPDQGKVFLTKLIKRGEAGVGAEYALDGQSPSVHCPLDIVSAGFAVDFAEGEDFLLKKYRLGFWDLPITKGDHRTVDGQKLAIAVGANSINLEKKLTRVVSLTSMIPMSR